MTWATSAPAISAAFLGSLVEAIEALTIVLAVATVRGWRPAGLGAADHRPMILPSPHPDAAEQLAPGKAASSRDRYDGIALGVECAWPSLFFPAVLPWINAADLT